LADNEQPEGAGEDGAGDGDEGPAGPDAVDTGAFDLRQGAERDARDRRRALAGELSVLRQGIGKVVLPLEGSRTLIGRDPRCDIVVDDATVSRRHAMIVKTDGGQYELQDAGSTGGVAHRGHRVRRMILLDGDRFQVGSAKFIVHIRYEDGA
jgi:hypothetical protein